MGWVQGGSGTKRESDGKNAWSEGREAVLNCGLNAVNFRGPEPMDGQDSFSKFYKK